MHDTRPAPGTIIGYRKDGRPIRLQAGGSEAAPEAPAPVAPAPAVPAPPAPVQPPAPAPQPPAAVQPPAQPAPIPQPPAPQPPAQPQYAPQPPRQQPSRPPSSLRELPPRPPEDAPETERLQWDVMYWRTAARQHEGRVKVKNEQLSEQETFNRRVAEALNIDFDVRPDPEELASKLQQATNTAKTRSVELAVYMTAAQSGVNASALLDSREFMSQTAGLDPESPDFRAHVADLVRAASGQPRYQFQQVPTAQVQQQGQSQPPAQQAAAQQPAAQDQQQPPAPTPPAPASGANFSGAPGGNRLWTQADLNAALANDRDGTVVSKAIEQGLLVNLGIGKPRKTSRR